MEIEVRLPRDERGFTGRECPQCEKYFKVKFATSFSASECHCPYCSYVGSHHEFDTKGQIEYAEKVAIEEAMEHIIGPQLQELEHSLKELERATRGAPIQIKVETRRAPIRFPLGNHQEKELETYVACDNCGLEFAIYGVFADCPGCAKLNALIVFSESIGVARKRLHLIDSTKDAELQAAILEDALSGGVSAFDALGKALQSRYQDIFPQEPRNLFQKLESLSNVLSRSVAKSVSDLVGKDNFLFLLRMFQTRHIYEHNLGVVDDDFIRKVPSLAHLKGRKYPLQQDEIKKFLDVVLETGDSILKIIDVHGQQQI